MPAHEAGEDKDSYESTVGTNLQVPHLKPGGVIFPT